MAEVTSEERVRAAVRRWRRGGREPRSDEEGAVLRPGSAYEAVTRQMVEDLGREIGEIKGRLNGLLFMVAGAIVLDVLLRLSGA